MRKNALQTAKLIVIIEEDKKTKEIRTVSVFDNRIKKYWTNEQIKERNISSFIDFSFLKDTLNWNLNGDSSKYQFKWGQSGKDTSSGMACIFD